MSHAGVQTDINWVPSEITGGEAEPVYDTLRSTDPGGFLTATCLESDDTDSHGILLRGEDAYYLLRLPVRSEADLTTAGSSLTESASSRRP